MGREFVELFDNWANYYDDTVSGHDEEYKEVFRGYDDILADVAQKSIGTVLEFGVGTGNLTKKLVERGHTIYGVEPNETMRNKAAEKLPATAYLYDGDFIQYPELPSEVNSIVSTYAFHHLTDDEKTQAIQQYGKMLAKDGKIVFADTMFENKEAYVKTIKQVEKRGFLSLSKDLQSEYYTTIPVLKEKLELNGFNVTFSRFNHFVWVLEAIKK
ncbi:class I SAM-dependent DNA methyltransferase [Bacillus sp. FJAT-45066]|uniref:class I SAM-dependent DNA methyltransferase n=1 Tax=Bacillus sp. FJAT-45066 TaxID=2011010 RepID=UPI000BB7EFE1|nr:class I SAM-dependent methyltransferase [Bacillus sp. FJAT-45066]